jgi:hypothetical protein
MCLVFTTLLMICINDVSLQMMYKRTKGQCKTKKEGNAVNGDSIDRALELMDEGVAPISLVASPRTRVEELKTIFRAEYPELDFYAHDSND